MISSLDELDSATTMKQRLDSIKAYCQRWAEAVAYEAHLIRQMTSPELSTDAQLALDEVLADADKVVSAAITGGFVTQEQIDKRIQSDTSP